MCKCIIKFAENNLDKILKQAENGINTYTGTKRAESLQKVKDIINAAQSSGSSPF